MAKWFFLFFFSGLIVLFTTLYFKLGGYRDVEISLKENTSFNVVFKKHLGPYHKIESAIKQVEKWAHGENIPCPKTFGEYLDNPSEVREERLRSHGGCIIDPSITIAHLPKDMFKKTFTIPKSVQAVFDGAPSIGPLKVYPKVKEWIKDHRLVAEKSVIEIYKINNTSDVTTYFIFPLKIN